MRTDSQIQKDIIDELKWEPSLQDEDIGVSVHDGVVTLAGFVDSYANKWKAERVASRVKGVKAIANDLEVKLPTSSSRPDPDIARAAVDALKWNILVPSDRIKVKVENGWLTLEGDVDWNFQREEAERAVRNLTGVLGVTNLVSVRERPTASDVKRKIKETLERNAEFDADHITVELDGHTAILRGTVRSYAEKRDAERAAFNATGVTDVENDLVVEPTLLATV
ncbi:MAG TPA: BON domain-containing protein [Gemmatimonadaceae bacterium]